MVTPFAAAFALAYLGDPLVDRLERVQVIRWNIDRTVAVTIVFLLMFVALAALVLIVAPLLVEQLRHLIERIPAWIGWLMDTALPWAEQRLGVEAEPLDVESLKQALAR